MPHRKRIVAPGIPLHITQRGVRRLNIFRDNEDRWLYLRLFSEASHRFYMRIYAYCLMTNHTHFVALPGREDSMWRTFHRVHSMYGAIFNAKYGVSGHLWEERPRSAPTDDRHFLAAVRYVEQNPVRAGLAQRAEDSPWSSARFHCGLIRFDDLLDTRWPDGESSAHWSEWLRGESDPATETLVRLHTLSGRPCGDDAFVSRLEELLSRRIRPQKPGPKPRGAPID